MVIFIKPKRSYLFQRRETSVSSSPPPPEGAARARTTTPCLFIKISVGGHTSMRSGRRNACITVVPVYSPCQFPPSGSTRSRCNRRCAGPEFCPFIRVMYHLENRQNIALQSAWLFANVRPVRRRARGERILFQDIASSNVEPPRIRARHV